MPIFSFLHQAGNPYFLAARELFEKADSFLDARSYLEKVPLLSPIYYIIGGRDQACVLSRSTNDSINPLCLDDVGKKNQVAFVVADNCNCKRLIHRSLRSFTRSIQGPARLFCLFLYE